MRITRENADKYYKSSADRDYVNALMDDIEEINEMTGLDFFIDFQDYHDEYSPERTDPCPDYFGFVRLKESHAPTEESLSVVSTLDEVDTVIFTVYQMAKNFTFLRNGEEDASIPFKWTSTMTTDNFSFE